MYVLLFGLIAAKITNRLVVAHMCKGEISHRDAAMVAPLLLIINQYFNTFISETFLLYVSMIWVVIDLLWYCSKVWKFSTIYTFVFSLYHTPLWCRLVAMGLAVKMATLQVISVVGGGRNSHMLQVQ